MIAILKRPRDRLKQSNLGIASALVKGNYSFMKQRRTAPESRQTAATRPARKTTRRLVLLALTADEGYRRTVLEGIAEFGEQGVDWEFFVDRPGIPPPAKLRLRFDGLIADPASWYLLTKAGGVPKVPAVTVTGDPVPDGPPAVIADNETVGRLGAEHLIDAGLKHLAFIHIPRMRYSDLRWAGFHDVAERRRVTCAFYEPTTPPPTFGEPDLQLQKWLRDLPKPIGIMAAHDQRAEELMHACHAVGLRIPEDVAVLGVNNEFPTCRLTLPPLSSVDHAIRAMGYQAAALLQRMMDGQSPPKSNRLVVSPNGVVTRRSTDLLAVADPDIAHALRFIRDNAGRPIKVRDVLAEVPASRRTLEIGFRAAIGRTIQGEITRVRIGRAKHLLANSDASMLAVTKACGLRYASQFSYIFCRECGMSPSAFRRAHRTPTARRSEASSRR